MAAKKARPADLHAEAMQLFAPPAEGSFPFQISWDDVQKVLVNLAWVALAAAVTYLLQVVIPGIHTDNTVILLLLPLITGALQTLEKWLRDTRTVEDQQRLPYQVYKARKRALRAAKIDADDGNS